MKDTYYVVSDGIKYDIEVPAKWYEFPVHTEAYRQGFKDAFDDEAVSYSTDSALTAEAYEDGYAVGADLA